VTVTSSRRRERIRRPDGTRVELPGAEELVGRNALAAVAKGVRALSGAARAAVRGDTIEPFVEARACVWSSRLLSWDAAGADPFLSVVATSGLSVDTAARPLVGNGQRANPTWRPLVLDDGALDEGRQAGPSVDDLEDAEWIAAGGFGTRRLTSTPLRAVPNPEGDPGGTAWSASAGAYTRPSAPTLPALGLPGTTAHRVAWSAPALPTLTAPAVACVYRPAQGRPFTVAGWFLASVATRVRARVTFAVPALTLVSDVAVAPAGVPTRLRFTVARPATPGAPHAPLVVTGQTVSVAVEVVAADTAGAATLDVRGLHLYAGEDRGDTEGLKAHVIATPATFLDVNVRGTEPHPRFNRVDVHGTPELPSITAATARRPLTVTSDPDPRGWAHGASVGPRLTLRFPSSPDTAPTPSGAASQTTMVVYPEEVNGPTTAVGLVAVEALHEVDLTSRVVEVAVDRSADADPASSSVPIGNYAASAGTLVLDNADRALSPFRFDYYGDPSRVELAVGVVYTNRHPDPLGDIDPTVWHGWFGPVDAAVEVPTYRDVVADAHGQTPPAAGMIDAVEAATDVDVERPGARVRLSVWARPLAGIDLHYVGLGDASGTPPLLEVPPGDRWHLLEAEATLATWSSTARVYGVGVHLAAPLVELLDTATGDVVEVVEVAPGGVFTSVEWPTATDADTVPVGLVDVLASSGAGEHEQRVELAWPIEWSLRSTLRRHLDLGDDQVRVATGTPVITNTIPADTVGQQLADLAKAAALTLYTDGAGRVVAESRAVVEEDVSASYREDNALIRAAVPLSPDIVVNDVTVVGHPVAATWQAVARIGNDTGPEAGVPWQLTGQELLIPQRSVTELVLDYDTDAARGAVVSALRLYLASAVGSVDPTDIGTDPGAFVTVGGGSVEGTMLYDIDVETFARFAVVTITTPAAAAGGPGGPYDGAPLYLDHLTLNAAGLTVQSIRQRFTRPESIAVYGRRPVEVDLRLATGLPFLEAVGQDVLDNYSLRDPSGERWLPDLEVEVLADPWRELGDRVTAREPDTGLGGEFRVVAHRLRIGRAMRSELYLRRVPTGVLYLVADRDAIDGTRVLSL
jgi:hypothetical protein